MTSTQDPADAGRAREPRLSAFFSPITDPHELSASGREDLDRDLREEQETLYCEILLSQRGWRCLVLLSALLLAIGADGMNARRALLIAGVAVAYVAMVIGLPVLCSLERLLRARRFLPAAAITADLLALGVLAGVLQPAGLGYRFLIAALLVVWASGAYFSRAVAIYASAASLAIYAVIAMLALPSPNLAATTVFANAALFLGVVIILDLELTRFRSRMSQLRMFCRQVAEGDVGLRLPPELSGRPDDATALALDIDSMRRRLAEQIGMDALTGCLNRRALESRLRGEWRLAKRRRSTIGILAVDLDHFKEINDIHGHQTGDVVLQQFSAIMRGVARESDVVARHGGDEFIIVLPDTDMEGTRVVAERLRERVAAHVFGTGGNHLHVTVSIGVALARGQDHISTTEIIAAADRSLYTSKESGRNRVSFGA
jgi:diguanylate cyclase (GGDEF)-like protein